MSYFFEKIWLRLAKAVSTIPDFQDWQQVVVILVIYGAIALPIGFLFKFTEFKIATISAVNVIKVVATSFLMPAVTEELFFRVLFLPQQIESFPILDTFLWLSVSLVAFIIYHPLHGLTVFPAGLKTFSNPTFLLLATLLGIACSFSYLQSGSLWTPVIIHWLIVVSWLLWFGGYRKLNA